MLTLCLIEDNEELGALTQEELIEAGYACDWYQSAELFPMSKIDRYHIFLIDVMLPGKDGFAMAEEIRKHSKVGIIFLTAKADYEDVAS
jgi:DNA-binding response OmpR family regulator